jgi:hypothetical protein
MKNETKKYYSKYVTPVQLAGMYRSLSKHLDATAFITKMNRMSLEEMQAKLLDIFDVNREISEMTRIKWKKKIISFDDKFKLMEWITNKYLDYRGNGQTSLTKKDHSDFYKPTFLKYEEDPLTSSDWTKINKIKQTCR